MQQSPSRKASQESPSRKASQEIPHILWNPKAHYRALRSPPLLPRARLIQSTPSHVISLTSLVRLFSHLCLDLPIGLSSSMFLLHTFFFFSYESTATPFLHHGPIKPYQVYRTLASDFSRVVWWSYKLQYYIMLYDITCTSTRVY
jgi:hypothetical protein